MPTNLGQNMHNFTCSCSLLKDSWLRFRCKEQVKKCQKPWLCMYVCSCWWCFFFVLHFESDFFHLLQPNSLCFCDSVESLTLTQMSTFCAPLPDVQQDQWSKKRKTKADDVLGCMGAGCKSICRAETLLDVRRHHCFFPKTLQAM